MTPHPGAGPRQGNKEGQWCGEHHLWHEDKVSWDKRSLQDWQAPRHQGLLLLSVLAPQLLQTLSTLNTFKNLSPFLPVFPLEDSRSTFCLAHEAH